MHWSASRWTPVKAVRIPEEETDETYKCEERMRVKEVRKKVFGREARTWGRKQAEIEKSEYAGTTNAVNVGSMEE